MNKPTSGVPPYREINLNVRGSLTSTRRRTRMALLEVGPAIGSGLPMAGSGASIAHARPHPPPLSGTPRLLARLLWRCACRHDRAPYRHPAGATTLGMDLRLLSGLSSRRAYQRHRGDLWSGPR